MSTYIVLADVRIHNTSDAELIDIYLDDLAIFTKTWTLGKRMVPISLQYLLAHGVARQSIAGGTYLDKGIWR